MAKSIKKQVSVSIPKMYHDTLEILAASTARTKSFYIRAALLDSIDYMEEECAAGRKLNIVPFESKGKAMGKATLCVNRDFHAKVKNLSVKYGAPMTFFLRAALCDTLPYVAEVYRNDKTRHRKEKLVARTCSAWGKPITA